MRHHMTTASGNARTRGFPGFRVQGEQGMVLVVSLIILMLLTLLAVTAMRMSVVEEVMTGNQKLAANALFAAEQGVSAAIEDLLDQTVSDAGSQTDVSWSAAGTVTGTDYSAAYTVGHKVIGGAVATTSDGRPYYPINATGTSVTATRNLEVAVTLEYTSIWNDAMVGCEGVNASSDFTTNSYSSSGGPSSGDQGHLGTTEAGADILLNSNADINGDVYAIDRLEMDSNARVRGDAYANGNVYLYSSSRVNGDARTSGNVNNTSKVDGQVFQNVSPDPVSSQPCDPLDIDAVFTGVAGIQSSNDNGELSGYFGDPDYWIGNTDTDTLGVAGEQKDYYLRDFTMDSDAIVTIEGDVTLYVDGDFQMLSNSDLALAAGATLTIYMESGSMFLDSNSTANNGGTPANFQVYSSAASSDHGDYKVTIDSNSGFYGTIYAPRAAININSNGTLNGAMRGLFAEVSSNVVFTYDEDLGAAGGGPPSGYKLVYWNETY